MSNAPNPPAPDVPLALLVGEPGGPTRSLEPLLVRGGYAVVTADSGAHALQRVRTVAPDAILVDARLPDGRGGEACRALRAERAGGPGTAIVVVTAGPPSRAERLDALHAGASDCVPADSDAEELVLRLSALVRAKLEVDRSQLEGLFDPLTGLYNRHGLVRRAQELASLMFRLHGALACLVLSLEEESGGAAPPKAIGQCARALAGAGRRSDVLAQIGPGEFAVLAPATRARGAVELARRLAERAGEAARREGVPARVRVGYEAITNLGYEPIEPVALLLRARSALQAGQPEEAFGWIRRFEGEASGPPA